tara:strand:+ start:146 stop:592 length:447 start_codon:yes stop_codon:yes gene_type:complete
MIIKLIIYIFIYTTLTGCDGNNPMSSVCESNCFLEMDAQNLVIDDNGYYNIEYNNGSNQTFSTLRARTGSNDVYQKLMWISDTEVQVGGQWINCVNQNSYTDGSGEAFTVLSVWDILIGDTLKVYSGYHDHCGTHFVDSIQVIVKDEF